MSKSKKPKIILWDLETAPNLLAAFNIWENRMGPAAILEEWYVICGSWKVLGEKKVHSVSVADFKTRFKRNPHDDSSVIRKLYKVLLSADCVIAHNGDKFDMKVFNTHAAKHGLPPLPNIVQIDTLKIAKAKFKLNSNRLDYLGKFFGLGKKMATGGHKLWMDCLAGKRGAIDKMVRYNKQDVILLEDVYNKLAPYVPAKLNMNHFSEVDVCPNCGSEHIHYRGYYYTRAARRAKFQCQDCGHWGTSGRSDNPRKGIPR